MHKIYKITEYVDHLNSKNGLHILYRDYAFRYSYFNNNYETSFAYPISYSQAKKGEYKVIYNDEVRNLFRTLGFYLDGVTNDEENI